jgi:hypothetical protein
MELERLVVDNNFEYVQIDTTPIPAPTPAVGQLIWNSDTGALQYGLAGGNVNVDLGLEEVVRCYNSEANTLVKGEVVYIFGAQGDQVAVKRANNSSDTTSSKTLGIVAENITSAGTGYVVSHGVINGLNTSAYTPGDILWLANTAGDYTVTKPVAPEHLVFVGVVIKSNAGSGEIFVKPQNGYELGEIHDVLITSPQLGEVLRYNGSLWINNLETGYNNSYAQIIGDGTSNTFVLTHNFNTRDIVVQCRNQNSPYENIEVRWEATTANTATLDFSTVPSSNAVRAIVYASVGAVAPSIFSQTIGDGTSNSYVISHNFNTRDVFVSARSMSAPFEEIEVTWEATSTSAITTYFSVPPASNSIRVSIHAAGGSSGITSIVGTANEIEVNTASATATIGLPDNVTISGNLVVTGDLTVSGNTTTLNTTELNVEDNIILLNSGETSTPSLNAGIEVERGTSTNVQIRWNETTDKWQFTNDGSTYKDLGSGGMTISDTAPGTPANGDLWYESDSGKTFVYYSDGTSSQWVEIGGSAYDSTIGIIQAKGDLLAGTQADGIDRLAVGTDNQRLIANSSANTGLSWASDTYNTLIDAKGDIIIGASDNVAARLPASTTDGAVLISDSTATNGLSWQTQNTGVRNLFYNGAMQVAQRSSSVAGITGTGYQTADRYNHVIGTLGTWTSSVENDAPTGSGLRKSLKLLCTTADASPAAGDLIAIQQALEGQDVQAIRKGTSSAQQLTLSFWVKSNVTGTYVVELYDNNNNRQTSKTYTVSASGTWEFKTITFAADTTGAFNNDNNASLTTTFWLGVGTNFSSGTLQTTWASNTNANRAVGQTNLGSAINNYWQITGVQLNVGAVAAPFEFKSYEQELAECQRYYEVAYGSFRGQTSGGGYIGTHIAYRVSKRINVTPTYGASGGTNSGNFNVEGAIGTSTEGSGWQFRRTAGTDGDAYNYGFYIIASAEL